MSTLIINPSGSRSVKTSVVIPEDLDLWAKDNKISLSGELTRRIEQMKAEIH